MALQTPIWSLGLMSGTSLDGVDAALIRTDGEVVSDFGPRHFRSYTYAEATLLRQALHDAVTITERRQRPGCLGEAERLITDVHAEVVRALVAKADADGIRPDLIGFHGQTVFHAPDRGLTVQIGDGERLARETGVAVVYDLRAADVAVGGQGAPLVPVYHRAIAARAGLKPPTAILNIGGVANVTLISRDGSLLAFDTGPGNALINDAVHTETGAPYDDGGRIAASGDVNQAALARLLDHPYFTERPPKSLDRNAFSSKPVASLPFPDRVATLTAFTARTIAFAVAGHDLTEIVVAGGGARNGTLMRMIGEAGGVRVVAADEVGLSVEFLEAEAFAYLAARRLAGLSSTWASTTRVTREVLSGVIARP